MSTEVLTNDGGGVIEANLSVAVAQGRISEGEKTPLARPLRQSPI
jgi:hypothetical protein